MNRPDDRTSEASNPTMLPALLARHAAEAADDLYLTEAETGQQVSYPELHVQSERMAYGLRALGVDAEDTVATMLPHSIDTYRIWFGLARLGALEVPIGTRYRGRMLEHILRDSNAHALVVDAPYQAEIARVVATYDVTHLRTVVVRGTPTEAIEIPGVNVVRLDRVPCDALPGREQLRDPRPHDLAMVLYTSGTTGASKGVLVPWGQVHATVRGVFPEGSITPGKVIYGPFPANHIGGRLFPGIGIEYGVPAVIRDTFSASSYWSDVATYGCTTTALVSAMATILWNAPPRPNDVETTLADVLMNPIISDYLAFSERFGLRVCTDFNMTETSIPTHSGWDFDDWRSCGRLRQGSPGYHVQIVDANDYPVAPGQVGELVCRTDEPWALNAGYLGRPQETAAAWRNGWFHTGDAFRMDEEGRFYFVDRMKDAIRRRGENVSSFEVEREILEHPDVVECAAIGVPSELGEEDIKVFVVLRAGCEVSADELIARVRANCAEFMVPRFVEFLDELPRTEGTQKVKKAELRARETAATMTEVR